MIGLLAAISGCSTGEPLATPETSEGMGDGTVVDPEMTTGGGAATASSGDGASDGTQGQPSCFEGTPSKPAPLSMLPSCPGPHVAQIEALRPGTWLDLGVPTPDPRFGAARGRGWTAHMPAADGVGGAFLYGEGNHGWWNERTGYFMDDLWFYDLLAHRWICLYPGTSVTDPPQLQINSEGFIAGPEGRFQPVATAIHGWGFLTYDSDRRMFLSPTASRSPYYSEALQPWLGAVVDDPARNVTHRSPWSYSVDMGTFDRTVTATATPLVQVMVYLPGQHRAFGWGTSGGFRERVAFFDTHGGDWSVVEGSGPPPPYGFDTNAVFDPARNRVYLYGSPLSPLPAGENALWIYDLDDDAWIDPQPAGPRPATDLGTHSSVLHYDERADAVLLFARDGDHLIRRYDPHDNAWTMVGELPTGDTAWDIDRNRVNAFYNSQLDVHVFFLAASSGTESGVVWVYRAP